MKKVDSIHIGNVKTGIILTYEDGTMENLPMTEKCYKERQEQAESLAEFWRKNETQ